jgi:hypothetical protein
MKDHSERAWHPKVDDNHRVRITRNREGLFVSSLLPLASRHDDARPLSRGERVMWRFLRRPPKVV